MKKKKAGLSDLQLLRDQFFENIESLRVVVNNNSGMSANGLKELLASGAIDPALFSQLLGGGGSTSTTNTAPAGMTSAASSELVKKFDLLYRQFQDLLNHCAGFVHRYVCLYV